LLLLLVKSFLLLLVVVVVIITLRSIKHLLPVVGTAVALASALVAAAVEQQIFAEAQQ
jgi:hypothetical protein